MKIKGKLNNIWSTSGVDISSQGCMSEIELTPRELLEQITHKDVGDLLDEINLPKEKPDKIEELDFNYLPPSTMEKINPHLLSCSITTQQIYQLKDKLNELIRKVNER